MLLVLAPPLQAEKRKSTHDCNGQSSKYVYECYVTHTSVCFLTIIRPQFLWLIQFHVANGKRDGKPCPSDFRRPKRQRAGALQDAPRSPDARYSRQRLGLRRPSAAFPPPLCVRLRSRGWRISRFPFTANHAKYANKNPQCLGSCRRHNRKLARHGVSGSSPRIKSVLKGRRNPSSL